MNQNGHDSLFMDLKSSSASYACSQVYIGWDQDVTTDIGWLSLSEGVERDWSCFQLRDFNCNVQKKDDVNEDNLETALEKKIGKVIKVEEKLLPVIVKSTAKWQNPLNKQCRFCKKIVKDLDMHAMKCRSINSKGSDRVTCPECDFLVLRTGFSKHLKGHTSELITCPHCNKEITKTRYKLYIVKCPSRHRVGKSVKCLVCDHNFNRQGISTHFRNLHPDIKYSFDFIEYDSKDTKSGDLKHNVVEGLVFADNYEDLMGEKKIKHIAEVEVGGDCIGSARLPYFEVDKLRVRLKFEMFANDGPMLKKIIKCLSVNPVMTAMKRFAIYAKKEVDDLEFLSKDYVLDGEELVGSIDNGLKTVRVRVKNDKDSYEYEMDEDENISDFKSLEKSSLDLEFAVDTMSMIPNQQLDLNHGLNVIAAAVDDDKGYVNNLDAIADGSDEFVEVNVTAINIDVIYDEIEATTNKVCQQMPTVHSSFDLIKLDLISFNNPVFDDVEVCSELETGNVLVENQEHFLLFSNY